MTDDDGSHVKPPTLPKKLLGAPVTTKIVWLYLLPLGWVRYSNRELARTLGISSPSVNAALQHLESLDPPLAEYQGERAPRERHTYRAVIPEDDAESTRSD